LAFITMVTMILMGIFVKDLKFAFELMGAICANLISFIIPAALYLGVDKDEHNALKT
jgi:amino acid permease